MVKRTERNFQGVKVLGSCKSGGNGDKRASISYTEDELKQSILNYAKSDFTKIRNDQMNGIYNRDADILEDYISKKSDDRTLYRGVKLDYADMVSVGDTINQQGISSWTTSTVISESFATTMARDGLSVVFVLEGGTKQGADISQLKGTGRRRETETLISKKSKQKVKSIDFINNIFYIKLKEI